MRDEHVKDAAQDVAENVTQDVAEDVLGAVEDGPLSVTGGSIAITLEDQFLVHLRGLSSG